MSELLFGQDSDPSAPDDAIDRPTMATAAFGERVGGRRYKMPLLPGESGPKAGGDWVPHGIRSATNLAGAISDTRALGDWERERTQIGLGLRTDLAERLAFIIQRSRAAGVEFEDLPPDLRAELRLIHDEAKTAAGGNVRTVQGTIRHDAWEERGKSGLLFGQGAVTEQIERLEELLERKGLRRVPGLQERTVRNVALQAAGRFDDVLQTTRDLAFPNPFPHFESDKCITLPAGTLFMADLKTKRKPFWSWLEVRIQLAVYATAEWMLTNYSPVEIGAQNFRGQYVPGPAHHVNQEWGIILRMPSDGGEPELKRANLHKGLRDAHRALAVIESRAEGKAKAAHEEAAWPDEGELA